LRSHPLPHRPGDLSQSTIACEAGTDISTLEIARNPENYRGRTRAVRREDTEKIVRVDKRHAEQLEGRVIADAEA
jgi:hypothetical protein